MRDLINIITEPRLDETLDTGSFILELLNEKKKHKKKKKKKKHHHTTGGLYGFGGIGLIRGVYACNTCGSHIPQQHVHDHCPVCTTPVVDTGGDAGGAPGP